MTNAPESRKTHITRIVGTNRAGDRLDDVWVDLERMEIIKAAFQIPPDFQWQGYQRKIRWCDDPDSNEYSPSGTPSRLFDIIKVCDPDGGDVDDPDEWVEVPVIRGMRSKGGGSESMGQGFMDRFVNNVDDGENIARIVEVRRIVHYDTNIDDQAQAAFDADPSRREYVVPGEFYEKDISSKDDTQGVDHEIVTFYKPKGNSEKVAGIGRQTKLRNEYLLDENDPADGTVTGASGINPPYRLDPFQNIVNVKFAPRVYVIIIVQSLLAQPSAFAVSLLDGVEVLETRQGSSDEAGMISGTLLECSASINDNILSIQTQSTDQELISWVCPTKDLVRNNWFEIYGLAGPTTAHQESLPEGPFLWATQSLPLIGANSLNWKIRYAPHLREVQSGQTDRMVQLYPTSGAMTADIVNVIPIHLELNGWTTGFYRLDRKGEGTTYTVPPAWKPDEVYVQEFGTVVISHLAILGLKFGVDPPLIATDVPL